MSYTPRVVKQRDRQASRGDRSRYTLKAVEQHGRALPWTRATTEATILAQTFFRMTRLLSPKSWGYRSFFTRAHEFRCIVRPWDCSSGKKNHFPHISFWERSKAPTVRSPKKKNGAALPPWHASAARRVPKPVHMLKVITQHQRQPSRGRTKDVLPHSKLRVFVAVCTG